MKIFSVILPIRVSGLLVSEFFLTVACFLFSCILFVQGDWWNYLLEERGWLRILIASLSVLLGLFVNNLYATLRVQSHLALGLKLASVLGFALLVQGLLAYLPSGLTLPRAVMLAGAVLIFAVLLVLRALYGRVLLNNSGLQQILFIGLDSTVEEIAERVAQRPEMGYRVAGYLSETEVSPSASTQAGPWLGKPDKIEEIVGKFNRVHIIVANVGRGAQLPLSALLRIARHGIAVDEAAVAYETICGRVCSRQLRPYQIIFFDELPNKPGSVALQSIYTNLLALVAIVVTSPVLLLAALAVKLTSRGPLLDRDMRVGLHGIPFSLHHFRCHRVDRSAETREQLLTPAGQVLQALHLVNLPRLFNLLRGEITLVGPKPERPEFAEELKQYFAFYEQRHSIKPGMTGWSQIHTQIEGDGADSLRQLEYDLYYTKHISLALDAYILLHGIRAMLPFAKQST